MPTIVYVSNNLPSVISVGLANGGPSTLRVSLVNDHVDPGERETVIARLPRAASGLFTLDFPFSTNGVFISALGILLDGSGISSDIWFRYRTSGKDLLGWVTDRDPHTVTQTINGRSYSTTVTGKASFLGFDDILVTLEGG